MSINRPSLKLRNEQPCSLINSDTELTFRALVIRKSDYQKGCIVLCCVSNICPGFLIVDLPGDCEGRIDIGDQDQKFYKFGDMLQAVVCSDGGYIRLSIEPKSLNRRLSTENGAVLYGKVLFPFGGGYIIDIGKPRAKGFLPRVNDLQINRPLYVQVVNQTQNDLFEVALFDHNCFFPSVRFPEIPNFEYIRPTAVFGCTPVQSYTQGSLAVLVPPFNPMLSPALSWLHDIHLNELTGCRPILVNPHTRNFWVSLIPSVVSGISPDCLQVEIGTQFNCKVVNIRRGIGADVFDEVNMKRIFIPLKKGFPPLSNEPEICVKITKRRPLEDTLIGCDADSSMLSLSDLVVGHVYKAKIASISPSHSIFFRIGQFCNAFCCSCYADDVLLLKINDVVDVVVMNIDESGVKVAMKSDFVCSDLLRVRVTEDAVTLKEQNLATHVIVSGSDHRYVYVEMFNGVTGKIRATDLPIKGLENVSDFYHRGHVMKVRIKGVVDGKITCSAITEGVKMLDLGVEMDVVLKERFDNYFEVALPSEYGGWSAVIYDSHFSDNRDLSFSIWKRLGELKLNSKVKCVLVSWPHDRTPAIFTKKRSFVDNVADIPKAFEEIKIGQEYYGYVSEIFRDGSKISFMGYASGFITDKTLKRNATVRVHVKGIESKTVSLELCSQSGNSADYLSYYFADCSDNYGLFRLPGIAVGDIVKVPRSGCFNDPYSEYFFGSGWKCCSLNNWSVNTPLKVVYVDVLSQRIFLDLIEDPTGVISVGKTIHATVVAVFGPVIVCKYNGHFILAPTVNFSHHLNYSFLIRVEQILIVTVIAIEDGRILAEPEFLINDTYLRSNVHGTFVSVDKAMANIKFFGGEVVQMHLTHIPDGSNFGAKVTGNIIPYGSSVLLVNPIVPFKPSDFSRGQSVCGIVVRIDGRCLVVSLSPEVNVTLAMDTFVGGENFKIGDRVNGTIISMNVETGRGQMLLFNNSRIVKGRIVGLVKGDYAEVRLLSSDEREIRKLDVCDVSDGFSFNPLSRYSNGELVHVIEVDNVYVSAKPSALSGREIRPNIANESIVQGYVYDHNEGLLVRIDRGVNGIVGLSQLQSKVSPENLYPVGYVVRVKILTIRPDNLWELELIHNGIVLERTPFDNVEVRKTYNGIVTGTHPSHGIFVTLCDFKGVKGLIPKSSFKGAFDPKTRKKLLGRHCVVKVTEKDSEDHLTFELVRPMDKIDFK